MDQATLHPSSARGSLLDFHITGVRCAGCVAKIEKHLEDQPGIRSARLSLARSRLKVTGDPSVTGAGVITWLKAIGYDATPAGESQQAQSEAAENRSLLMALAVAAFGAGNVMLLSLAVWTGTAGGMGPGTATLFGWISAAVALPVIAFAGRPFFTAALSALKAGRVNMDVPIALALVLTAGLSLHQLLMGAGDTYFEAATTLIFFLLIGRYLDRSARTRARSAIEGLLAFQRLTATCLDDAGLEIKLPATDLKKGMFVLVRAGEYVPADGVVIAGNSTLDTAPVTGESLPVPLQRGDRAYAGTINLAAPLTIQVDTAQEESLAAKTRDLMESAEQRRTRYVRLASRAAAIYIPVVHGLAVITFLGWWLLGGLPWQEALFTAISVLIITCPCALGLAIPAVQIVAGGHLFRRGILQKSADGLERLCQIDHVLFDKTGTLTTGRFRLSNAHEVSADHLRLAAALAQNSHHPLCSAICAAIPNPGLTLEKIQEHPGLGIEAMWRGQRIRMGNRTFCAVRAENEDDLSEVFLLGENGLLARLAFMEDLRPDARQTIDDLAQLHLTCSIASGDRQAAVARVAKSTDIRVWRAEQLPTDKAKLIDRGQRHDQKILMVGDGLNDGPALAGAYVSMAPSSGLDISTEQADLVFRGSSLSAVSFAIRVARAARHLMKQNLWLAVGYNMIAVPIAMAGLASPPIAAIAMSFSSIIVTVNALRLGRLLRTPE